MKTRGSTESMTRGSPSPGESDEVANNLRGGIQSTKASVTAETPEQKGTTELMERVVESGNMNAAWKKVKANAGKPGIDGMTIEAFPAHLKRTWESELKPKLLDGSYRPAALRRKRIPKPHGGERLLGIPTVQDRVIQQAILQVIQPIVDPGFSEHSYGFRPQRSAHQAVAMAQKHVQEGWDWVVDMDLEAFFDRVNHDRLMSRLGLFIKDKRVLWIIRGMLRSGIMEEGVMSATVEGTPQGGPLSPLLANLVLDELDKELERRGLRFVRYADDCNVYLKSERAAQRAYENLTEFIEVKLKLKVNREKSAVARPWERKFLGFSLSAGENSKRRIAPKAKSKFKEKIRELTTKGRNSFAQVMGKLGQYMRGWIGYFQWCQTPSVLKELEGWVRRRLRNLIWQQWKRGKRRADELIKRGADRQEAYKLAGSSRGSWRISRALLMSLIFSKEWFAHYGLPSLRIKS